MQFLPTALKDVVVVEPDIFGDHRGFFMETWHAGKFAEAGIRANFVQDNHSSSSQGTLRGLHYQVKQAQGKLVRVIHGEVFDVAVDLRSSSPTFGRWAGVTLAEDNRKMLWIPPGFAHGFYVLSPFAELVYKCTEFYAPAHERTLIWNDTKLKIAWPLSGGTAPVLSTKDAAGVSFKDAEYYP